MSASIAVTLEELDQLENAVRIACVTQQFAPFIADLNAPAPMAAPIQPLYLEDGTGALVVSFDKFYHPFLCDTRGYNQEEQRWFLPKRVGLLTRIGHALREEDETRMRPKARRAGRVFCYSDGVVRRPQDAHESQLLGWTLPRPSQLLATRHTHSAAEIIERLRPFLPEGGA